MKSTILLIISAMAALAFVQFGTGCAGLTLTARTPYGDISTTDGATTIAPRPIVIPGK